MDAPAPEYTDPDPIFGPRLISKRPEGWVLVLYADVFEAE
jgi:hypothetical protein